MTPQEHAQQTAEQIKAMLPDEQLGIRSLQLTVDDVYWRDYEPDGRRERAIRDAGLLISNLPLDALLLVKDYL
jgi:L-ribulose-5-phosphate 3-epimerase UlaE